MCIKAMFLYFCSYTLGVEAVSSALSCYFSLHFSACPRMAACSLCLSVFNQSTSCSSPYHFSRLGHQNDHT
ncbi:hypothetical protein EJ08DRAFT_142742 [Tothia fuscella]|uniref:Secreted protein n=1 Tax=Tothia fuscella TaxID=1048955 RepID=A0A9P4U4V8_9PEZI|nr:hypothetical protein EJ08DRAFT_142742 [Tothia fuscella]